MRPDYVAPQISQERPTFRGLGCFGIAAVTFVTRPDGVLIHLKVLFADVAKDHGGETSIAYRQGLHPLRGGLPVPELESVILLSQAQAGKAKCREQAGGQKTKSHDKFLKSEISKRRTANTLRTYKEPSDSVIDRLRIERDPTISPDNPET